MTSLRTLQSCEEKINIVKKATREYVYSDTGCITKLMFYGIAFYQLLHYILSPL